MQLIEAGRTEAAGVIIAFEPFRGSARHKL
jgi:hypothetical protein